MPVTREEVVLAYRMFLGREPESDEAVRVHMECKDLPELRQRFLNAPEFIETQLDGIRPQHPYSRLNQYRTEIESDADEVQLSECIAKIKEAWSHLGEMRPHFSVLTHEQFLPDNLNGSINEFWASGESEAALLQRILARYGYTNLSAMTCVEYGCGVGRVTSALASRFAGIHAYDISPSHLLLAEKRVEEIGARNVEFHLCSDTVLEQLCECDVFYSRIVFQHNPPPLMRQLIKSALKALIPGGVAVFQVPTHKRGYRFKISEWLRADHPLDMQMHCLPQEVIFKVIQEENCVALEVSADDSTGGPEISNVFVVRKSRSLSPIKDDCIPPGKLADAYAWRLCLSLQASEIVKAVHLGLMGFLPEDEELSRYRKSLSSSRDLTSLVLQMMNTASFRIGIEKKYAEDLDIRNIKRKQWANPSDDYQKHCLVFLHIQKTAGTSIQNHLGCCFSQDEIYREHSDSLYLYSPAELNTFNVFAGHFNYDSLRYIPRRDLSIFTFVRDPKKRLISLYHFWRAHEPGHPSFHNGMALANEFPIDEFFENIREENDYNTLNHMTWAIMGERKWRNWNSLLKEKTNSKTKTAFIGNKVRPAIAKRLSEFTFIGMQEDFERSVLHLYKILRKPAPQTFRTDHSLKQLMETSPMFKREMEMQDITIRVDAALDHLVQLDNIVYEEATKLYAGPKS